MSFCSEYYLFILVKYPFYQQTTTKTGYCNLRFFVALFIPYHIPDVWASGLIERKGKGFKVAGSHIESVYKYCDFGTVVVTHAGNDSFPPRIFQRKRSPTGEGFTLIFTKLAVGTSIWEKIATIHTDRQTGRQIGKTQEIFFYLALSICVGGPLS